MGTHFLKTLTPYQCLARTPAHPALIVKIQGFSSQSADDWASFPVYLSFSCPMEVGQEAG